jgi:hypothetical protein
MMACKLFAPFKVVIAGGKKQKRFLLWVNFS